MPVDGVPAGAGAAVRFIVPRVVCLIREFGPITGRICDTVSRIRLNHVGAWPVPSNFGGSMYLMSLREVVEKRRPKVQPPLLLYLWPRVDAGRYLWRLLEPLENKIIRDRIWRWNVRYRLQHAWRNA